MTLALNRKEYEAMKRDTQKRNCIYPDCKYWGLYKYDGLCGWHRRLKKILPNVFKAGLGAGQTA